MKKVTTTVFSSFDGKLFTRSRMNMEVITFDWWIAQLAGENPESHPGSPEAGFYIRKSYFHIPYAKKRVLVDMPVAIWYNETVGWVAWIAEPIRDVTLNKTEAIDDLFASCCREAIEYKRYLEMIETIGKWRRGERDD